METWELFGATREQIQLLSRMGKIERLDDDTITVTVEQEDEDRLVEWCEDHGVECRLL